MSAHILTRNSSDGTRQKLEKLKYDEQKNEIPSEPDSSASKQCIQISPEALDAFYIKARKNDLQQVLSKFGIIHTSRWTHVQS